MSVNRDKIPPGQLKKILSYNKIVRESTYKADAGKVLADAIAALPQGQRKRLLTDDVLAALHTLGIDL